MLRPIHKKHKDRYRSLFCDQEFYREHQDVFKLWKTRFSALDDVEKVRAWVVGLSCLRRPMDWYGGKNSGTHVKDGPKSSLSIAEIFEGTPIRGNDKVAPATGLLEFINNYKVKALPEACFRSLARMSAGEYPLDITWGVPSPRELLELQITGRRLVSFNEDFTAWPAALYSGRDFLGFVLHDLIHADHFFHDPLHRDGQLGFYLFIRSFLEDSGLKSLLELPGFKSGFEYIISDMNSHPVHLFQTLYSLLFSEIKDDQKAVKIWRDWIQKSAPSPSQMEALMRINSSSFTGQDASQISLWCISLGNQTTK